MRFDALMLASVLVSAAGLAGCDKAKLSSGGLSGQVAADKDAGYTILLYVVSSADHQARSLSYKDQTERQTGWPGMFVVHKDTHSELYWGKYVTGTKAAGDLLQAKRYRTPAGIAPYAQAIIVPLPGSQPGPPEWNLRNAKGAYTVVIATFYDVPEAKYFGRKKNAIAYCKQLRESGEEAYYLHGPANSSVTIGTFNDSAVRMVTSQGQRRPEVHDARILAIQKRFPSLAVNGREQLNWKIVDPVTRKLEKVPDKTYPARIPSDNSARQADSALDYPGNTQPF